jgi:REP element-mobilizing transposase RayT
VHPTRLLAYCLMPNHWHMVVWPEKDGELTDFLRWLTNTHSMRWHAHYHTGGTGHIYQNRFKSFPVQTDNHLYSVLRYVERNASRANLVTRAESWRWGSLWRRYRVGDQPLDLLERRPSRSACTTGRRPFLPTGWRLSMHHTQCVSRGLHAPFEKTHAVQQVVSRTTPGRRRAALRHRNNQGVQRGRARCPTSRPSRKGCSSSFMTSIKPWRCGLVVA